MSAEPISPPSSWTFRRRVADCASAVRHAIATKEGLIGDYDYAHLFRPNLPFMRKRGGAPFFGLNVPLPALLALLLGFQHALAMLAGIITPPILLAGQSGANLDIADTQYLVSTSLIVSGVLSLIQITRIHVIRTPYYIGSGLISVVGTSFAIVTVGNRVFSQMYETGFCPKDSNGLPLPCPHGYGALLGTSCVTALWQILLSFLPPKVLQKIFPPLVTGPTLTLIGASLVQTGFQNWAGGTGPCAQRPPTGPFRLCPQVDAPHALAWGSPEFIGLGFSVFVTIILCERFGSPIMKSTAVILGLLIGCIIAATCGYFSSSGIDAAPVASFIWVRTFGLSVYGPAVLPFLAIYTVNTMETIGDVTASCDVSKLEVTGRKYDTRIQGGILADGLNGILAALCTITPMSTFAQNNGVIALTRCANRKAGYAACMWLIVAGVFSKFAAALVSIPSSVLGGMTTFLFGAVVASGIRIVAAVPFTRRNRFVLTASVCVGLGAILNPSWFSYVFSYNGDNQALKGFLSAIVLVMETGFVVTGFLAVILNLLIPEEEDEDEEPRRFEAHLSIRAEDTGEWVEPLEALEDGKGSQTARTVVQTTDDKY